MATPVFLPGDSQGWGGTESDTTEVTAVVCCILHLSLITAKYIHKFYVPEIVLFITLNFTF